MRVHEKASDSDLLAILDMRADGMSCAAIAARLGKGRNQIVGITHRILVDCDLAERAVVPAGQRRAQRPENRDGSMPARWWVAGLAKQTELARQKRRAA